MIPLDDAESAHLKSFASARPDWRVCVLNERVKNESAGRSHKYDRAHPYILGMAYVLETLKNESYLSVLDIGSPIAQNVALNYLVGHLEVLDVRPHEDANALGLHWREGNATELPYPDGSWPYVTSLWVMGHVGDGRYGDPMDFDGDKRMLREVHRVLEPGGVFILGAGLLAGQPGYIFNLHRIYSWDWLRSAFDEVGFSVLDKVDFEVENEVFLTHDGKSVERRNGYYALAKLRKR